MWSYHNFRRRDVVAIFFLFLQITSNFCSSRPLILETSAYGQCVTRLCLCLLSTWQQWISIGPFSKICSFMVHLGSAQGKGKYLCIEGQSSLLYLPNKNRLFDHFYSKDEAFFYSCQAPYIP